MGGKFKKLYLRPAVAAHKTYLLYSLSGVPGSYLQYSHDKVYTSPEDENGRKSSSHILTVSGVSIQDINKIVLDENKNSQLNPETIAERLTSRFEIEPSQINDTNKFDVYIKPKKKAPVKIQEYGMGIKQEQIPNIVPLGKVYILLSKLYYQNILSVKNKQKKSIAGISNTKSK